MFSCQIVSMLHLSVIVESVHHHLESHGYHPKPRTIWMISPNLILNADLLKETRTRILVLPNGPNKLARSPIIFLANEDP